MYDFLVWLLGDEIITKYPEVIPVLAVIIGSMCTFFSLYLFTILMVTLIGGKRR